MAITPSGLPDPNAPVGTPTPNAPTNLPATPSTVNVASPTVAPVQTSQEAGMAALKATGADLAAQGKGYNNLYNEATTQQGLAPAAASDLANSTYTTPAPKATPVGTPAPNTQTGIQPTVPPVTPTPTVTPTATTTPGATTPTTPGIDSESIINQVSQTTPLTDDEKNAIRQGLANGTLDVSKVGAQGMAAAATNILNAYRTTRDANLTANRNQQVYQKNVADTQSAFQVALDQQKANMQQQQNAMSLGMESSGRLQSQNMQQGIHDALIRSQNVFNTMVATNDRTVQGLADQYKYQQQALSNNYNDQVSSLVQSLVQKMGANSASGGLDTNSGLLSARSDLDKTLSDYIFHQTNYAQQLGTLSTMYEARHKEALTGITADPTVTTQFNDGFAHNTYGQIINDPSTGQPLKINTAMGKFVGTTKLPDGSTATMYQQLNGDIMVKKAEGTQGVQLDQAAVDKYAKSISTGALTVDDLEKAGIAPATIAQIVGSGNFGHVKYTETPLKDMYGQVTGFHYSNPLNAGDSYSTDKEGNITGTGPSYTGGAGQNANTGKQSTNTTGGTDLSSMYTGNNGPAFANNNPGNIKDTGFGGTPNGQGGFTKFATAEEGVKALMDKLDYNKANGVDGVVNGSAYNGNMTLQQFFNKYAPAGDNNDPTAYARAVASGAGVTINTKIKDVDTQDLALGIMQHENGAYYQQLVKAGIVTPEGINLAANTQNAGEKPGFVQPGQSPTADQFMKDISSGNFSVTPGSQGTTATQSTNPIDQPNTFGDGQIGIIRGLLQKQATGMLNVKGEAALAMQLTGINDPSKATEALQPILDSYGKNPEFTTNEKSTIKNILNGDQSYVPSQDKQGYILNEVQRQAQQAGIDWNPNDFSNQNKTKLAFATGKYGQQIAAAATAMDHMEDYKTLLEENGNTQIPAVNDAWNRLKTAFGLSGPVKLNVLANTVGDELAGAYNINTGGGKEVKAADFASKLSPDQGTGGVATQIKLLKQKLQETNDNQYKPIMNQDNKQIMDIINRGSDNSKASDNSGSSTTSTFTSKNGTTYSF